MQHHVWILSLVIVLEDLMRFASHVVELSLQICFPLYLCPLNHVALVVAVVLEVSLGDLAQLRTVLRVLLICLSDAARDHYDVGGRGLGASAGHQDWFERTPPFTKLMEFFVPRMSHVRVSYSIYMF